MKSKKINASKINADLIRKNNKKGIRLYTNEENLIYLSCITPDLYGFIDKRATKGDYKSIFKEYVIETEKIIGGKYTSNSIKKNSDKIYNLVDEFINEYTVYQDHIFDKNINYELERIRMDTSRKDQSSEKDLIMPKELNLNSKGKMIQYNEVRKKWIGEAPEISNSFNIQDLYRNLLFLTFTKSNYVTAIPQIKKINVMIKGENREELITFRRRTISKVSEKLESQLYKSKNGSNKYSILSMDSNCVNKYNTSEMFQLSNYLGDMFPVVEQRQYPKISKGYKVQYEKELSHAGTINNMIGLQGGVKVG